MSTLDICTSVLKCSGLSPLTGQPKPNGISALERQVSFQISHNASNFYKDWGQVYKLPIYAFSFFFFTGKGLNFSDALHSLTKDPEGPVQPLPPLGKQAVI